MERSKQNKSKRQPNTEGQGIKRTKALNYLTFFLLFAYISILITSVIFSLHLHKVWFSGFLVVAGIYLIVRGLFFHLDSNYLLGFILFGFGIFSGLNFFYGFIYEDAIYVLLIALSFLSVYFIFRQNIYIISFALSCLEVLLLVINKLFLNIFTFILLQAMVIAFIFVVFFEVTRIKRENKSAISDK